MKQETIHQSREQLEQAFSSLGGNKKSNKRALYIIILAIAMLIIGIIIGGVAVYDIAEPDETAKPDTTAINLMHQIAAIDSSAQVSLVINDTTRTFMVTKQDSVSVKN